MEKSNLPEMIEWLRKTRIERDNSGIQKGILLIDKKQKRNLELIGLSHSVVSNEYCIFGKDDMVILKEFFKMGDELDIFNAVFASGL
ncbi:hypothetical protein ACFL0V_07385 [Nanoarchaeota archaeon]